MTGLEKWGGLLTKLTLVFKMVIIEKILTAATLPIYIIHFPALWLAQFIHDYVAAPISNNCDYFSYYEKFDILQMGITWLIYFIVFLLGSRFLKTKERRIFFTIVFIFYIFLMIFIVEGVFADSLNLTSPLRRAAPNVVNW